MMIIIFKQWIFLFKAFNMAYAHNFNVLLRSRTKLILVDLLNFRSFSNIKRVHLKNIIVHSTSVLQ